MDVAAWLRSLGLERYEEAFRENEIDWEVLPELNEADLERLGLPLGPRKKLLKAIREHAGGPDAPRPAAPVDAPPNLIVPSSLPRPEAERRQLTVMFADLVGSTELASRLDPEEMREIITAYQSACTDVVERFEGHVALYLGDGVLAFFGYPRAHEDDAERAVRAGLDLVEKVAALRPRGIRLRTRIGIDTGLVVVGDLLGKGALQQEGLVGDVPNLAARLQALATPDSIVISPGTRRLVGYVFDYADLGERRLKGFAAPVQAWRVLGLSAAEGRFGARSAAGLTPLVGRETETRLLLERWEQVKAGKGQVVMLVGEAGIGKSRILQAFNERLAGESLTRLRYFCSPYAVSSALFPVVTQLERAAGFDRGDTATCKLDKLEALLRSSGEGTGQVVPLVAAACGIPTGDRYPPLTMPPQRQKGLTFEAMLSQLTALAARQPVLMLFEDAHWIDPTTQELFQLVVGRIESLPVLLVMTCRPEFVPPWTGYAHVTGLHLDRLGRAQSAEMIERVTGKPLPEAVRDQILAKTDGVPLFMEELTKTVLETGLLRDAGDRFELEGPLPAPAIPATLQDSLMARLDRLAPVKEVAQIGAAIGREFPYELLRAVAPMGENQLGDVLEQLVASELVFRRGVPPARRYMFKHALVQDVAYASMLRSSRQSLHKRIAQVLERGFAETTAQQPELLARHYAEAGLPAEAVSYWLAAARQAARRSANAEALAHLERGFATLAELPDTPENRRTELELLSVQVVVLRVSKGYGSAELMQALGRARSLCEQVGTTQQLFQVLFGLWTAYAGRGDWAECRRLAEECLAIASDETDRGFMVEAHRLLGSTTVYVADFAASRDHLEQALALYDPDRDRGHAFLYGYDPWVTSAAYVSWPHWHLGYPDKAAQRSEQSIARADASGVGANVALALGWATFLRCCMRDLDSLDPITSRLVAHCTEGGFPQWAALGRIGRGWLLAHRGDLGAGIPLLEQGLREFEELWGGFFVPYWLVLLAEARGLAGAVDAGLEALARSEARIGATGEFLPLAELHRVRGDLLRAGGRPEEAEASYREAFEVARRQQALSLELRAALRLAELGSPIGRQLLTARFTRFTEGFATRDVALAAELSGR